MKASKAHFTASVNSLVALHYVIHLRLVAIQGVALFIKANEQVHSTHDTHLFKSKSGLNLESLHS